MLPILYQSPDLTLYAYPLMMGLGWGVAYQIFFGLLPQDIPRRYAFLLYWGVFLFAWFGSKILFLFTVPQEITKDILMQASFWMGGGFVFYGGLIGGVLFLVLYRSFGLPLNLKIFWPIVPALAIGHGIGRIGCALAGCCYGDVTDWLWGIHLHGADRHPTQLLEAGSLLLLGFYLLKSRRPKQVLICHYLLAYGIIRLIIEALRGDVIRGLWGPLTPSQWISILLIFAAVIVHFRPKNPVLAN
ncbi:MAG TPA: prolipoprotein diacylglyceryl transferase family protein [Bacteriovoracaceae bacterium]|nr:prolipoprotein diacylglyceryl transferase family protein [Bacteriovoracaceae bacterium]